MPGSTASIARWPRPSALLWRILLAGALVLALEPLLGNAFVSALVPAFRAVYQRIDPDVAILELRVANGDINDVLILRANLAHDVYVNGYLLQPLGVQPATAGWYEITLTVGGVLQALLMALIVALAWPALSIRELLLRVALLILLVVGYMLLDTPVALSAGLWKSIYHDLAPNDSLLRVEWSKWMEGGGRLALGALAGGAAVALARRTCGCNLRWP